MKALPSVNLHEATALIGKCLDMAEEFDKIWTDVRDRNLHDPDGLLRSLLSTRQQNVFRRGMALADQLNVYLVARTPPSRARIFKSIEPRE